MHTPTFAIEMADLYQSRTPIESQNDQERERATLKILQQVLLKVVGNQTALVNKDLTPLLAQADQFVEQYAYERDITNSDSAQQLRLIFNEQALNQAISAMGLPLWGKSRPEMIIWLIVNESDKQEIFGVEDDSRPLYKAIKLSAEARGLSLFLPLMDLQDQHQLRFAQTGGKMTKDDAFMQASKRYGADLVILARVNKKEGEVLADWQWLEGGEHRAFNTQGAIEVVMTAGVNQLADQLAKQYAVVDQQDSKRDYQLVVHDINDFTDYSRVQSYINSLEVVSEVNVVSLRDKQLDLKVRLASGLVIFNHVVKQDGLLIEAPKEADLNTLYYRLRP
jgi:hypothetical protein